MGPFSPRPMRPISVPAIVEDVKPTPAAPARPPRQSVIGLTLGGLDQDARDILEKSMIAASKSGRFMMSVFYLVPEDGNPMLVMRSATIISSGFPVADFNLCQEHFHTHLANMSAATSPAVMTEPPPAVAAVATVEEAVTAELDESESSCH